MIATSRDMFLLHLGESGLLTAAQLQEAADRLGGVVDGTEYARALVGWGWLTKFQARMLLHGRSGGFVVGPYRILEQIGRGGMGKVYKALHQTMQRTVALKVLAPSLVKTAKARRFFANEACTAAQLNHPNIVSAYDAGEVDGRHFLAMEYIAGTTLSQLVHQRGALPISLACEIVRQTALGLQHAHTKGLVHRDIKPANLMVSVIRAPGTNATAIASAETISDATIEPPQMGLAVKILDFGLARLQRRVDPRAANDPGAGRHPITGTPDFMSPEQARNRNIVDIRADLYSLGCTFYYLLTGQAPFAGGGLLDKLIRHQSEVPASPATLRPQVPAAVAAIVLRLLAKDAAARFQTPQELADALAPHASLRALNRVRSRCPAAESSPATLPSTEGTVDLRPTAAAPTLIRDEHAALASWVEICVDERRKSQRKLYWTGAAVATLVSLTTLATLLWLWAW